MRNKHTNTRKILITKLPPKTLIEPTHAIIRIRRRLSIRDPIEKMPIVCSFLPHTFHFRRTWLKVSEILFAETRLFEDFDFVPRVRRRGRVVAGKRAQYSFGGFAGSAVGGREELDRVVGFEEGAELVAGFFCLGVMVSIWIKQRDVVCR